MDSLAVIICSSKVQTHSSQQPAGFKFTSTPSSSFEFASLCHYLPVEMPSPDVKASQCTSWPLNRWQRSRDSECKSMSWTLRTDAGVLPLTFDNPARTVQLLHLHMAKSKSTIMSLESNNYISGHLNSNSLCHVTFNATAFILLRLFWFIISFNNFGRANVV